MERQITRVGIATVVLLLVVFVQLNRLQIFAAEEIASNPSNSRRLLQEYSIKRGEIITEDTVTIARSVDTGGQFRYERRYPEGDLFGHTTGFYSILFGTSGIESAYNDELLGESNVISMQVYAGDLGLESGEAQSVYALDKSGAELVTKKDGSMFRVDLALGD
ncbi:MAG TPA: hypothetical protein VFD47_07540, partial [Actinomycetota bacterium]|nr:hypothetical protein [Actinomycetota bacterium]